MNIKVSDIPMLKASTGVLTMYTGKTENSKRMVWLC